MLCKCKVQIIPKNFPNESCRITVRAESNFLKFKNHPEIQIISTQFVEPYIIFKPSPFDITIGHIISVASPVHDSRNDRIEVRTWTFCYFLTDNSGCSSVIHNIIKRSTCIIFHEVLCRLDQYFSPFLPFLV